MKQYHLKKIRVIIALIFFLFMVFFFLDFRKLLPEAFYDAVLYLQFVPSLLKFISVLSITALGFLAIIVVTALFGRVYCSAICPLGIMQDCIIWIKRRFTIKHRFRFSSAKNWFRYPFLALAVISYLAGTVLFINLLDPYSNFGRIISDFLQPVYILMNNTGARLLEKFNVFFLYPENISMSHLVTYIFPAIILGLIIWMSIKWGRLYCNTVCPVGTLLGLLSRFSVFKIKIINEKCTKCGKCAFDCKASCIDIREHKVDFSRCIGCYNCIRACPEDAIRYLAPVRQNSIPKSRTDITRRKILISAGLLTLSMLGLRKFASAKGLKSFFTGEAKSGLSNEMIARRHLAGSSGSDQIVNDSLSRDSYPDTAREIKPALPELIPHNKVPTTIKPEKHFTVTPPGSLGIKHFTDTCTACHLCVSACPSQVLQPSVLEYGIMGLMQPFMDYETNYCTFECVICSEICPTGAILSLTQEAKKTVQIGKVNLIIDNCVVKTDNTACGSCSEHCPTQAVRMVPYFGDLTIPEIRQEICVGCGACEHACPTRPFKAIYVDGNYQHQTALLPDEEKLEEEPIEEFPF
jgi:ferredoxin